jgi:hypothetical protein
MKNNTLFLMVRPEYILCFVLCVFFLSEGSSQSIQSVRCESLTGSGQLCGFSKYQNENQGIRKFEKRTWSRYEEICNFSGGPGCTNFIDIEASQRQGRAVFDPGVSCSSPDEKFERFRDDTSTDDCEIDLDHVPWQDIVFPGTFLINSEVYADDEYEVPEMVKVFVNDTLVTQRTSHDYCDDPDSPIDGYRVERERISNPDTVHEALLREEEGPVEGEYCVAYGLSFSETTPGSLAPISFIARSVRVFLVARGLEKDKRYRVTAVQLTSVSESATNLLIEFYADLWV